MHSSPDGKAEVDEIVSTLGLTPLPDEGGLWAQSWRDHHSSAIYFLLQPNDFSALHRLAHPELWHFYGGAPVELVLLSDAKGVERPTLGMDLQSGYRPCVPVPEQVWMGARTRGAWSLVGATVSPPYEQSIFELGSRQELLAQYPQAEADILALTRES